MERIAGNVYLYSLSAERETDESWERTEDALREAIAVLTAAG